MKRSFAYIFVIGLLINIGSLSAAYYDKNVSKHPSKKKVLIFTSEGGGGHMAATRCLQDYLGDTYEIETALIFSDVLGILDPGRYLSFRSMNGEYFYNFFMERKWNRTLNAMYLIGYWYYGLTGFSNRYFIKKFIEGKNPDLVISVVPLINSDIIAATNKPLIIAPTDLNARTFIPGIHKPDKKDLTWCVPFACEQIKKTLEPAEFADNTLAITGFPIRKDFFEQKDHAAIKSHYKIPDDKPVIMLLMGSVGLQKTVDFAYELSKLSHEAHLILCTGRNFKLKTQLEGITFPKHVTRTIVENTPYISDLMAVSDLLITKSGSVSFCEGMYSNLPMLLDGVGTILRWELFNHDFAFNHGFGGSIKRTQDIAYMVDILLGQPKKLEKMKQNLVALDKKNGGQEIRKLVDSYLS